jgi:16S rRNA A1518/A1519 N6-dimethyltransferase RsmA/KsgA/DIM1 with predicted DNA glycosylase/AP lyase activity
MVRGLPHLSEEDLDGLLTFVKRCFAQKRKNLINNLSSMASRKRLEQELDRLQLPPTIRAEEISIEQFADLFKRFR